MPNLVSQRMSELMSQDRDALDALLGQSALAHIALTVPESDGGTRAVVFPTGFAVIDGALVIHGSTGSRWMRGLVGQDVTLTVTHLDGVVIARSTYESSMLYRSAMIFGRFTPVSTDRKERLLALLADRFIPGRSAEVRASSSKEVASTLVLELPIETWSLRISDGWAEDTDADLAGDAWSGHVRFGAPTTEIIAAPDLRAGIPVPASVRELAAHPERLV